MTLFQRMLSYRPAALCALIMRMTFCRALLLFSSATFVVLLASCGGDRSADAKVGGSSARQTISFALSGLPKEEAPAIEQELGAFERRNPGVKVKLDILSASSPDSGVYLEELEHRLSAGSPPDLMEVESTALQMLAKAGWLRQLSDLRPALSGFFAAQVAAGELAGEPYAIPWVDDPLGLFYRTDLVPSEPRTPREVVLDAKAAVTRDRELKIRSLEKPFAFAGYKNEAIATLEAVAPAFGGSLAVGSIDAKGNVEALEWLRKAIYVEKIAPVTVNGWDVGPVQDEFSAGRVAFAIDAPFVAGNEEPGSPTDGKSAYVPFPAGPGGRPGASAGGDMLAIAARSKHAVEAYKLIQFLTSQPVEVARAQSTYAAPSLRAAYSAALYAKWPVFKQVRVLAEDAEPGLVSPAYSQVAKSLTEAITSVLGNKASASTALKRAASQIDALEH